MTQTKGAARLQTYLDKKKIKLHAFCFEHHLPYQTVVNAMKGHTGDVKIGLAKSIEEATDGYVKLVDWTPEDK